MLNMNWGLNECAKDMEYRSYIRDIEQGSHICLVWPIKDSTRCCAYQVWTIPLHTGAYPQETYVTSLGLRGEDLERAPLCRWIGSAVQVWQWTRKRSGSSRLGVEPNAFGLRSRAKCIWAERLQWHFVIRVMNGGHGAWRCNVSCNGRNLARLEIDSNRRTLGIENPDPCAYS